MPTVSAQDQTPPGGTTHLSEQAGLVRRASSAASRTVTVTLTPEGHALVERLVDRVLGREAELISCLSPEQQTALTELPRTFLGELEAQLGAVPHTQVGST